MKANFYFSFLLLLFISSTVCGQVNTRIKEDVSYQKSLKFDGGLVQKNDAISAFTKEYNLSKENTFEAKKASTDRMEVSHQRHQQYYKGIKVEYGMLITHSANGAVTSINGELYNAGKLNLVPTLTPAQGLERALIDTHAKTYLWEDTMQSKMMEYKKPQGELVIFPIVRTGETKLAYKYDVYAMAPISRNEIYVDAHTGQILYKNPIIKHADRLISDKERKQFSNQVATLATGNAATRYSGTRSIETSFDASISKFVLNDVTRGDGIVTYNSAKTTSYPSTNFTDADNNWTALEFNNANKDNAALDAHWGAEMTYDFWKKTFNRNSYDNNGAKIKSYVHYDDNAPIPDGYDNAFWNGSVMTYGDGTLFNALTAIDVCGHEIGHAVCTFTADLVYQNQSGGMNEGYSDVWGACVEHFGRTGSMAGTPAAAVWLIGEDLFPTPLRSMSDPNSQRNPDCVGGTYWTATADDGSCVPSADNDHCGVHNNSGVMNHWFYMLSVGETGTNNATPADTYTVAGIGILKAAEIAYLAERDYLTPNSTYADARSATLSVVYSLYCATSPEFKAVTNAWYAVNVGDAFTAHPNDVSLKSVAKDISVSCGKSIVSSIVFENYGTNPITSVNVSYSIDGGTPTVETWNGTLALCSSQSFPLTIGAQTAGTHILSVTTTIVGDGNATNNTRTTFIVANESGTVNTVNTFNSPSDVLVSIDESGSNSVWERGTSTKTQLSDAVAGNSPVYATRLAGLYPDKTVAYLVSKCYDLTNVTSPLLKFNMAYDFETEWDIMYMEYSTNNGSSWSVLGTGTSPTWYTNSRLPNGVDCFNCIGGQWTGEGALANPRGDGINAKMREYSYSLSQFGSGGATPASNMLVRFVFHSDDAATEEGAIIDNFVIEGAKLATVKNEFNTFSVYPNPSKGTITLSLSTNSDVKVSLFDISGRNIYAKSFNNSDLSFNQELKFNTLSKGIYLLNVESDGKKASKKLIIE